MQHDATNMEFSSGLISILRDVSGNAFADTDGRTSILSYWREHLKEFMQFFYRMGDANSKNTFLRLLRFNMGTALSGKSVRDKFAIYSTEEWNKLKREAEKITSHVKNDYVLDRIETFVLEGYNYNNICKAEAGDIVFDCGAFTGNTAVYFASKCAGGGHVYAFEAMPSTYQQLVENVTLPNVTKEQYAISDQKKTLRFTAAANPASRVAASGATIKVPATSIDAYVEEHQIPKVDFIKMDIEGSEMDALQGAQETCRKFHPKLAICIYHKDSDWIDIPRRILSIRPDYTLYIQHSSDLFAETVVFAMPSKEPSPLPNVDSELPVAEALWDTFTNIYRGKWQMFREKHHHLLREYMNGFDTQILQGRLDHIYDEHSYDYGYVPLSDDGRIHYEFLLYDNEVTVGLHMEGQWKKYGEIFRDMDQEKMKMQAAFSNRAARVKWEVVYRMKSTNDVDLVIYLMKKVVKATLPILLEHGLVADKYVPGLKLMD